MTGRLIFINTLPKSASRFIVHSLGMAYGAKTAVLVGGQFPHTLMSRGTLQRLRDGIFISQEPVQPSPYNRMVMEEHIPSMVLHVRDPRQVMVSWAHHLDGLIDKGNRIALHFNDVPSTYRGMSLDAKLDFVIERQLPMFVDWLAQWSRLLDSGQFPTRVLLTRYEDMAADPAKFFERIVAFYGWEPLAAINHETPEPGRMHFRAGRTDEWREVMSAGQQQRATESIGEHLLNRFGWPLE